VSGVAGGKRSAFQSTAVRLAREQLARGASVRLRVSSGSMAPLIAAGDEVIVEAVQPAELCAGEVVVLDAEGGFVMHRLLAWQGKRLVTRGDSMLAPDPPWLPEQVLGRVRTVLKADGRRLRVRSGTAPMGLRLLWRAELVIYRLAQIIERRLLGDRPCCCSTAVARLITAPSRRWLSGGGRR